MTRCSNSHSLALLKKPAHHSGPSIGLAGSRGTLHGDNASIERRRPGDHFILVIGEKPIWRTASREEAWLGPLKNLLRKFGKRRRVVKELSGRLQQDFIFRFWCHPIIDDDGNGNELGLFGRPLPRNRHPTLIKIDRRERPKTRRSINPTNEAGTALPLFVEWLFRPAKHCFAARHFGLRIS